MGKANIFWSAKDDAWIVRNKAGSEIARFGNEQTFQNLNLKAASVVRADLADENFFIEHITCLVSATDNETLGISKVWNDCTVVRVVYWTSGVLGGSNGIDILDGGAAGSGSDIIDSSSDNLDGFDANDLPTPYALSAGDFIRIKFDDFDTAPDYISVDIQLKVLINATA